MTKARALSVIREGPLWVLALTMASSCKRASRGQLNTTRKAFEMMFLHPGTDLTLCRHIYRTPVGIYMRKLWCSERQREGADRDRGSGRVQGIFFWSRVSRYRKVKLLPDPDIHPCSYPSCLLVFRFLSFHSALHLNFFFFFFGTSHLLSLFYSGSCGGRSGWVVWHRVTMSVGKQSLSRIPLSLWQSSSSMKPYQ